MDMGKRVYRLRVRRKLAQQELAERARVDQSVISRLERHAHHNITADVLKRLATVLGCTTDYLVGMHEEEDSEPSPMAGRSKAKAPRKAAKAKAKQSYG